MSVAEKEELLAKKREEKAKAEAEQYEKDLDARIELEDEHDAIVEVKVSRHVKGQPTRAYLRMPKPVEYKRFKDRIQRASGKKNESDEASASGEQLARACWVYPKSEEEREAMLEAYPGILVTIAIAAAALAQGRSADEGKG